MATFAEAVELEKAGKLYEAYTLLMQLSQSTLSSSEVWTHMGAILLIWNRGQEALNTLEHAIRLDAQNPYAWEGKARALLALDRKQDALQAADYALRLRPDLTDALLVKGKALTSFDDEQMIWQGIACFDQILAKTTAHLDAITSKTTALLLLQRWDDAYLAGNRAIALDPNNRQGWRARVFYHWERREFDPALAALDQVLRQTPDDGTLWSLRGGILRNKYAFVRNKIFLQQAMAAFDEALRLKPGDALTIQARRETLAVQRSASFWWSRATIASIWLGGWILFFVTAILGGTSGGSSGLNGAVTFFGVITVAAILLGWGMALIRTAQEGRWILFTFILLFGNFLVPIVAIAFLLNKATQLARS